MGKAKRRAKRRAKRLPWVDCRLFEDLSESYLARSIAPQVAAAMEAHYFSCDRCSDGLLTLRALQVALQERREVIRGELWATIPLVPTALRIAASRAYAVIGRVERRVRSNARTARSALREARQGQEKERDQDQEARAQGQRPAE